MTTPGDAPLVALVTGAARGIGAATARRLAREGHTVALVDACGGERDRARGHRVPGPTRDDLDAVAADCGATDRAVLDVTDPGPLAGFVDDVVARHGRLDLVVAAAAIIDGGDPLWETPPDVVERLLRVDAMGVWHTAAATVPHLLRNPEPSRCRFVAVASAAGTRGLFHLAAYTMAKHAVVGLVRGLAADLVGTGVAAIAVCPGSTDTPMLEATAQLYGLADAGEFAAHQSGRRLLTPEEQAEAIAHCCSAAGAVHAGAVVSTDGGFSG